MAWWFKISLGVGLAVVAMTAAFTAGASEPSRNIAEGPMRWAYPAALSDRPEAGGAAHRQKTYTMAGSKLVLTAAQLDDPWSAVDWLPGEHPPAPPVVLHGRQPDVYACGLCHRVDGQGTHGVPALAGLPRNYIVAQMAAFATGQRVSTYLLRDATNMTQIARGARSGEVAAAADYFGRLTYRPVIHVIEAARVPATVPSWWGWTDALPGSRQEPVGRRIVEVAEDPVRATLSDPHSGFIAYVPPGAVARGRAHVLRGMAGQPPCAACHGAGLKGSDAAPPLAGRSPTYLARQLWDMRTGARHDAPAAAMQPIARALDAESIVDVTAYLASLKP